MHTNKIIFYVVFLIAFGLLIFWITSNNAQAPTESPQATSSPVVTTASTTPTRPTLVYKDLIKLSTPLKDELIQSPLTITGFARGTWFFEASFPVTLTNWDGLIIAEGIAQAQSDWMTEDYVPFTVTLTFDSPYKEGDQDFMQRGSLILKKDNPSGLPENDDAYEVTVMFAPVQ